MFKKPAGVVGAITLVLDVVDAVIEIKVPETKKSKCNFIFHHML